MSAQASPAAPWRRMSRGVLLAGLGFFLLLTTTGVLPRGFWLDAARYWPVLLVGLGLRLMFERSRTPWAILLSPLVILGTLAWIAVTGPVERSGPWEPVRAARPAAAERWRLEGNLLFASADLTTGTLDESMLVTGRCVGMGDDAMATRGDTRNPLVEFGPGFDAWRWPGGGIRSRRCELDVSDRYPFSVDLETAFARGDFDLAAAPVSDMDIEGAFNDLTLRLGAPVSTSRIDLDGAFNRIELVVPEDTRVSVRTDGPLNIVSGRRRAGRIAGPGWILNVDGAFNRIVVRSEGNI